MHKNLFSAAILSSLLLGCAPKTDPGNQRFYTVKDLSNKTENFTFSKAALWPEATETACARLQKLSDLPSNKRSRFAFLAEPFSYNVAPDGTVSAIGSIDLLNSPLIQYVLTTPAVEDKVNAILNMPDDKFLQLAKERLNVDQCSAETVPSKDCVANLNQWTGAVGKYKDGILYQEKPNAVARQLRLKFAGVFGDTDDMTPGKDGSLFLALLDRVGLFRSSEPALDPDDASAILTAQVPLFPKSRLWNEWLDGTIGDVPAAIAGLSNQPSKAERLCSLVLWQRMFAQLLMIKGYEGPKLTPEGHLPAIPAGATSMPKMNVPGGYINPATSKAVILQANDIPKYDPNQLFLENSKLTPIPRDPEKPQLGSLKDSLDRLEAYVWIYAATSPAAPWNINDKYLFGDLVESDLAIAPFQTHTLALGLIVMTLRNLGHDSIIPVDTQTDTVLNDGNGTGMILLTNGKASASHGEMHLYDLMRMTTALVRLDDSLDKIFALGKEDPKKLEDRSVVFSKDDKAGTPFYTPEKLQDLEALKATINRLKYPLAHRMIRMSEAKGGCIASEKANYTTNGIDTNVVIERCSPAIIAQYKETMRLLANDTGSKIYYEKSQ